jgi:hypothetical protein
VETLSCGYIFLTQKMSGCPGIFLLLYVPKEEIIKGSRIFGCAILFVEKATNGGFLIEQQNDKKRYTQAARTLAILHNNNRDKNEKGSSKNDKANCSV